VAIHLALKIVATTIQDVLGGQVAEFLSQEAVVFGDIRELLGSSLSACHFRNRNYVLVGDRAQTFTFRRTSKTSYLANYHNLNYWKR